MRAAGVFLIATAILGFPLCALAQDEPVEPVEPVEPDPLALAYELNEQGFEAFGEGRYADAANAFAQAWELSRDETLRKNESLAWFRANQCAPAVEAGNKFLLVDGISDSDKNDIHSVIANCKVVFARRAIDANDLDLAEAMLGQAEQLENADSVAKDRIAATRVDLASARQEAVEAAARESEIQAVIVPEPVEEPPILGYTLIGAGAAVGIGALAYHLIALGWQSDFGDLESGAQSGDQERFDSLRNRVHTARVLVPILYSVGLATAGAGVVVAFILPTLDETGALRPSVGFAARF